MLFLLTNGLEQWIMNIAISAKDRKTDNSLKSYSFFGFFLYHDVNNCTIRINTGVLKGYLH